MRNFYTVVLDRMKYFSESFDTEPYETGWASEAIFFIRVHELSGRQVQMKSFVEISVDGIEWIQEGSLSNVINRTGNFFLKVRHFGGWLRLHNDITGKEPNMRLTIHLVLKE